MVDKVLYFKKKFKPQSRFFPFKSRLSEMVEQTDMPREILLHVSLYLQVSDKLFPQKDLSQVGF